MVLIEDDAGLVSSNSANVGQAGVGDTVIYTYRITNTGNVTFTTVTATDSLSGTVSVAASVPGLQGQLNPQQERTVTVNFVVPPSAPSGLFTNTLVVTGTDGIETIVTSASAVVDINNPTNLPEEEQPEQFTMDLFAPFIKP